MTAQPAEEQPASIHAADQPASVGDQPSSAGDQPASAGGQHAPMPSASAGDQPASAGDQRAPQGAPAVRDPDALLSTASIQDKSSVIARAGMLALASGTGAYRVRHLMARVAAALGARCRADVDLVDIDLTVSDGPEVFTEVVSLRSTGVNTHRMQLLQGFVEKLELYGSGLSVAQAHQMLDQIEATHQQYAAWQHGLAAGAACGAFVFLLGGGPVEMFCAAIGAGLGNLTRRLLGARRLNHFAALICAVVVAGLAYLVALDAVGAVFPGAAQGHQGGYIGALLFVIPGFPLITGGLDLARFHLASGLQRLTYAFIVITLACFTGWMVARTVGFYPSEFPPQGLDVLPTALLRLAMSFVGVFGFSVMFNSTPRMCLAAAMIGMIANTLRLELVDLVAMPPEAAALVGALASGLLASVIGLRYTMPRITLTVPSIVIMVPGLYLYRAMYFLGEFSTLDGLSWALRALIIILCLPLGLALARVITDPNWRYD